MRPVISPPLDPHDFEIEVVDITDVCSEPLGAGATCAPYRERTALFAATCDVLTACTPAWLRYAVPAALRGELPRTRCFVVPSITGGVAFDLGTGPVARPQVFGGAACHPSPWGRQCDEADPHGLPEHEALAPRSRRRVAEPDEVEVVFEDWDGLRSPLFGGKGATA